MLKIIKSHFLSLLLKIILNSIFLSCRWKIIDENNLLSAGNRPRLVCCWHSRGLFIARYLKYKNRASGLLNSYLGNKSWKRPSIK